MHVRHYGPRLFVCAFASLLSAAAGATNGYSPTGFGTTNKGLAGAGVALPQDALAAATNPAGMVHLGHRLDVGAALFMPKRSFTANSDGGAIDPGTYDSNNDLFLVPHFGWNRPLDENSSVGISVGGNGGMNTEYDYPVWHNFAAPGVATAPTGVDLSQLFVGFTYARKLNDRNAIGVMPILAVQAFEATGLEPFQAFSVSPDQVTNNGHDYSWGYGIRVGWLGKLTDRLDVGVSAQSKLYMTRFDDYKGLFAEGGDFDIPPTVTVGISYAMTPSVTVVADWQRIFYSDVKSLGNPNDVFPVGDNRLGADEGLGFGWEDINIFKLGVQWVYSPQLTLRAGVSHASQLFDNGEALFNILAPATVRTHASLGLTYRLDRDSALSLAYTHAFDKEIKGTNPVFTGPQTGSLQMYQHELEISWSMSFD